MYTMNQVATIKAIQEMVKGRNSTGVGISTPSSSKISRIGNSTNAIEKKNKNHIIMSPFCCHFPLSSSFIASLCRGFRLASIRIRFSLRTYSYPILTLNLLYTLILQMSLWLLTRCIICLFAHAILHMSVMLSMWQINCMLSDGRSSSRFLPFLGKALLMNLQVSPSRGKELVLSLLVIKELSLPFRINFLPE